MSSKASKSLFGVGLQADNTNIYNKLLVFDLTTNSLTPTSAFCLNIGYYPGESTIRNTQILGNQLCFAGTFTKINNDTKNTNNIRIRFPPNYFTPCEIANCGNKTRLKRTADDLNTGIYKQKSNLNI